MKAMRIFATLTLLTACSPLQTRKHAQSAEAFILETEAKLQEAYKEDAHAEWIAANFITIDSQALAALAVERYTSLSTSLAKQAAQYDKVKLPAELRRKLDLLKLELVLPAPNNPELSKELAQIHTSMEATYGEGQYCRNSSDNKQTCLTLGEMSDIMASSRDPKELLDVWQGWRTISPPLREPYRRLTDIANQGAKELGYDNLGILWRSKYDMPASAFEQDIDHQWQMVKPFYEALHCHVRAKLVEQYGTDIVDPTGAIPAHLLGNMWAQTWSNIYDLVKPEKSDRGYDLDQIIANSSMTETDMVKVAENFFISLGFDALPETFWQRSLFVKPKDREVVCHASAWTLDNQDDLRIKMCIKKNAEDFEKIHHELGHTFYQRAYKHQPYLFMNSANDGFHEALGDTISLSVNPSYLKQIGLLDKDIPAENDLGYLMSMALDKIAFLPWGILVDQWRWRVFDGRIQPENYNQGWWDLREKLQGIKAPIARSENDFDPGAKYHIPGNTPYTRYFLAFIQQFQFHRALCDSIGYKGPLHRCSIYNSKEAGKKLQAMMAMGQSQPWPNAMTALTGQPNLDSSAIMDYFAPLKAWLDEQNKNRQCGW